MPPTVAVQAVQPRRLLAARRRVPLGAIGSAWKPALDLVWTYLRAHPKVRRGHNVFLYHHPADRASPMDVDFGVELLDDVQPPAGLHVVTTPAGQAAVAIHRGPYEGLKRTHDAVHAWAAANGRSFAGTSWEVYGDWTDDPATLEVTVAYLLA